MNSRYILIFSIILYILSLCLENIVLIMGIEGFGFYMLLTGWIDVLTGNFVWFGNAFYLSTLMSIKIGTAKPKVLLITSIIAFAFGMTAFIPHSVLADEAGNSFILSASDLAIGYYVWMASLVLLVAYSYQKFKESHNLV